MQLPPFNTLLGAVKDAIRSARKLWRAQYVSLCYEEAPGAYRLDEKISGNALLVVHPTGHLICLHRGAEQLYRQVRDALLAEG